ncbi:hypothetical protein ACS0TY_025703 [Phlomoides rotata]
MGKETQRILRVVLTLPLPSCMTQNIFFIVYGCVSTSLTLQLPLPICTNQASNQASCLVAVQIRQSWPSAEARPLSCASIPITCVLSLMVLPLVYVGHYLSGQGGGFLFFGDDFLPDSGIVWKPIKSQSFQKRCMLRCSGWRTTCEERLCRRWLAIIGIYVRGSNTCNISYSFHAGEDQYVTHSGTNTWV